MIGRTSQKIINWIKEEGWDYQIPQDDGNVANILIHPNKMTNVNIVVQKSPPQKIRIITKSTFRDLDIKAYLRLSDDAKQQSLINLEILLIHINLIYNIYPNPPKEIHGVEISRQIYCDGLTRDRFFDSVLAVLRGLRVVQMNYYSLSLVNQSDTSST
jgi:hypothetical protein